MSEAVRPYLIVTLCPQDEVEHEGCATCQGVGYIYQVKMWTMGDILPRRVECYPDTERDALRAERDQALHAVENLTRAMHAAEAERDALRQQVEMLRTALVKLVGADTPAELEQMEIFFRTVDAPAADKAASIDAIHALLAVQDEKARLR